MTTIRLLDARRGLNRKCEELFGNAKIAEAIYRFLCDGIEECEDADVRENVHARWKVRQRTDKWEYCECQNCGECYDFDIGERFRYCPNCGAEMEE